MKFSLQNEPKEPIAHPKLFINGKTLYIEINGYTIATIENGTFYFKSFNKDSEMYKELVRLGFEITDIVGTEYIIRHSIR